MSFFWWDKLLTKATPTVEPVKPATSGKHTFLVDPLHGEQLVIVHGAHVLHLPIKVLVRDGRFKMCDHDVPTGGQ